MGVSIRWLMDFRVARFAVGPEPLPLQPLASSWEVRLGCLEVEADERGSFVHQTANPPWLGLAMDKPTRQLSACSGGVRSRASAKPLGATIPAVSRENATFSTDPYAASTGEMPLAQHKSITQHARKTHHIERFNNTLG
jgi:IS1 family transposase